jgi:NAD(P)-dependent dehydrogenase (short-subunit alcohol dehydrogenase family)
MTGRVLVLGGAGVLGSFIAERLRARGHEVVRAIRPGRPDGLALDLADPAAVAAAAAAVDLTVSTVREPRLTPERAVLARGGVLLSIASLTLEDRRALAAEARGAPGLVVLHAGANPGVSTAVLKDLLARHPGADGAELVVTLSRGGSRGRHGAVTAALPLLKRRRRHPVATVDVPQPYGRRRCMAVGDGSEGFFGEVGGGLRRRLYWCHLEPAMHQALLGLNTLGVLGAIPSRALARRRPVPSRLSTEPKRDVVAVSLGGRRLGAVCVEGEGDYAVTVAATVVYAELLLARRARAPGLSGCFGAEDLVGLAELAPALAERGVTLRELEPDRAR